jgi:hypothetical protein
MGDRVSNATYNAMVKTKKRIVEVLNPDTLIAKRDGTFEARSGYFYRHGRSADGFASRIKRTLGALGLEVDILEVQDRWAPWPRDSYFMVRFAVQPVAETVVQA